LAATTGAITFNAYKYESKPIQVSAELLQDSGFDMAALAGELLGERLGRAFGVAHTTSDGSAKPKGIVICATAGVTAAAATAIQPDELLGLVHSLDPAYRTNNPSVGFMMHDSILLYLRKLKDGEGQYLWQPGLSAGAPDRLLGYPIAINQNMQSSVATNTVTVLFADFSKFIIRDSGPVRLYRLDELYRAKDLTGFVAFARTDSDTIATTAIRKLTQA
jgi:HK97 family phage major capsid protein